MAIECNMNRPLNYVAEVRLDQAKKHKSRWSSIATFNIDALLQRRHGPLKDGETGSPNSHAHRSLALAPEVQCAKARA